MEGLYWGGAVVDFEGWQATITVTRIAVTREYIDRFNQPECPW
jgi:hypothetical protein